MAQAVIIDIAIAAVLLLAILLGAHKGLLKSVAGLVIVLVSLVGAALVSNVATPFISQAVKPALMEVVEEKLAEIAENADSVEIDLSGIDLGGIDLDSIDLSSIDLGSIDLSGIKIGNVDLGSLDLSGIDLGQINLGGIDFGSIDLSGLKPASGAEDSVPAARTMPQQDVSEVVSAVLEQMDPTEQVNEMLAQLGIDPAVAAVLVESALERMADSGMTLVEALVDVVLETVVHAVVFLLAFVLLNIVLRIVLAALGLVLMLPGLRTLNSLGGAAVAFVEAVLLLFLMVWVARRCAMDVTALSEGTVLLRFFVNNTPLSVLNLL